MKYMILPLLYFLSSIAFADLNMNATNGTVTNSNDWRLAMSLPKENPTKRLYLNPSSIKRQGANVTYQEKWEYLTPLNKFVETFPQTV